MFISNGRPSKNRNRDAHLDLRLSARGSRGGGRGRGRGRGRAGGRGASRTQPGWQMVRAPKRDMSTIIMTDGVADLEQQVRGFLAPGQEQYFADRQLPYQRCFMLYGPPGNGKSSFLQALGSKYNLKVFFLAISPETTLRDLRETLHGCSQHCLLCIEDVESAFATDADVSQKEAKEQGVAKLGRQLAAKGDDGKGGAEAADDLDASRYVTARMFVDLIKEQGSRRLIFFSSNHLSKVAIEVKQLADQQGGRTCFPNQCRAAIGGAFDIFYCPNHKESTWSVDEVAEARQRFLDALGGAKWFKGFSTSNISGASLSEYFQLHTDSMEMAIEDVTGPGSGTLQSIVAMNTYVGIDVSESPEPKTTVLRQRTLPGAPLEEESAARTVCPRLTTLYVAAVATAIWCAVERGLATNPASMTVFGVVGLLFHAIPTRTWATALVLASVLALGTLDCDADGHVWGTDLADDTELCIELIVGIFWENHLIQAYVAPRLDAFWTELVRTVPMGLVTFSLISLYLLGDHLWPRARNLLLATYRAPAESTHTVDHLASAIVNRVHVTRETRVATDGYVRMASTPSIHGLHTVRLHVSSYDETATTDSSVVMDGYIEQAQLEQRWFRLPGYGGMWLKFLSLDDALRSQNDTKSAVFRVLRWGWSWRPYKRDTHHAIYEMLEAARGIEAERNTTTILDLIDGNRSQMSTVARVGGVSSFVWPKAPLDLQAVFSDVYDFQTTAHRRWCRERGIPYRRGYVFQGPPSSGKMHFTKLLASVLGVPLTVVDLEDPSLTDEKLICCIQGNRETHQKGLRSYSIVVYKGVERAVTYRSFLSNPQLHYTTLLNVRASKPAPVPPLRSSNGRCWTALMRRESTAFARVMAAAAQAWARRCDGQISIILCSDWDLFRRDTSSADALLRPGRVCRSVSFAGVWRDAEVDALAEIFVLMMGEPEVPTGFTEVELACGRRGRISQLELDRSDQVHRYAQQFAQQWRDTFEPDSPTKKHPQVKYTFADAKGYLNSFAVGPREWGGELSSRHLKKSTPALPSTPQAAPPLTPSPFLQA